MENVDLTGILTQIGFAVIFLWLFWTERKAHDRTRDEYINDLKTIAGLKQQLGFTKTVVDDTKSKLTE